MQLKANYTDQSYMHKPESIMENHLIPDRSQVQVVICTNKRKYQQLDLFNKGKQKTGQILGPWQRPKKLWNMNVIVIIVIVRTFRTITKNMENTLEQLEFRGRIEYVWSVINVSKIKLYISFILRLKGRHLRNLFSKEMISRHLDEV